MASPPNGMFSVRTALISVTALLIAVLAGVLSYLAGQSPPTAVLCGGGAFASAMLLGHRLIDRSGE